MSIVVVIDGIIAIEDKLEASTVEELFTVHKVDQNLTEDSVIEEAYRLKQAQGGKELIMLATAPAAFEKEMRTYIAAGCDRAIRVECDYSEMLDVRLRAAVITDRLQDIDDWNVVMFLDRTAGGTASLLPHYVSELLGVPSLSSVVSVEAEGDDLIASTRRDGISRRYKCGAKTILCVSSRAALHNLGFKDVHRSRKAEIEVFDANHLDVYSSRQEDHGVSRLIGVREPVLEGSEEEVSIETLSADSIADRIISLCSPHIPS